MSETFVTLRDEVESLEKLIDALVREHRDFPIQIEKMHVVLAVGAGCTPELWNEIGQRFLHLQDTLVAHMVTEESDVYPVLMNRGLFDQTVSEIMQQHHELTAEMKRLELALREKALYPFKIALDELEQTLRIHQPAEEEKVFPLAAERPEQSSLQGLPAVGPR